MDSFEWFKTILIQNGQVVLIAENKDGQTATKIIDAKQVFETALTGTSPLKGEYGKLL